MSLIKMSKGNFFYFCKKFNRGKIAFATNEESKVYFDGIHAIPYDSN